MGTGELNNGNVGAVILLEPELFISTTFSTGTVQGVPDSQTYWTLENQQFDGAGNVYNVFDSTDSNVVTDQGIVVPHQFADRPDGAFSTNRDRTIVDPDGILTSPTGMEIG